MITISPLDFVLYTVAAFFIIIGVLVLGILIGTFLRRHADKHYPPVPQKRINGTKYEEKGSHRKTR